MSILFEEDNGTSLSKRTNDRRYRSSTADKYDDMLVFGYHCKLFHDEDTAVEVNQGKHLIPWMGNTDLMIDRYDCRGHLYRLEDFDFELNKSSSGLSHKEEEFEALCDKERYMDLTKDMIDEEILKEEEEKRTRNLHDLKRSYQTIQYTYDVDDDNSKDATTDSDDNDQYTIYCQYYGLDPENPNVKAYFQGQSIQYDYERPPPPPEPPTTSQPSATIQPVYQVPETFKKDTAPEKFIPPEGIDVPKEIELPETRKMQSIIEKTAVFISKQSAQMEIVLKTKQSGNPQFSFLDFDNYLNPYYKFILSKIKEGVYKQPEDEVDRTEADNETQNKEKTDSDMDADGNDDDDNDNDDDGDDDDDDGELHPLLQAHRRPAVSTVTASVITTLSSLVTSTVSSSNVSKHETSSTETPQNVAEVYLRMRYNTTVAQEDDNRESLLDEEIKHPETSEHSSLHSSMNLMSQQQNHGFYENQRRFPPPPPPPNSSFQNSLQQSSVPFFGPRQGGFHHNTRHPPPPPRMYLPPPPNRHAPPNPFPPLHQKASYGMIPPHHHQQQQQPPRAHYNQRFSLSPPGVDMQYSSPPPPPVVSMYNMNNPPITSEVSSTRRNGINKTIKQQQIYSDVTAPYPEGPTLTTLSQQSALAPPGVEIGSPSLNLPPPPPVPHPPSIQQINQRNEMTPPQLSKDDDFQTTHNDVASKLNENCDAAIIKDTNYRYKPSASLAAILNNRNTSSSDDDNGRIHTDQISDNIQRYEDTTRIENDNKLISHTIKTHNNKQLFSSSYSMRREDVYSNTHRVSSPFTQRLERNDTMISFPRGSNLTHIGADRNYTALDSRGLLTNEQESLYSAQPYEFQNPGESPFDMISKTLKSLQNVPSTSSLEQQSVEPKSNQNNGDGLTPGPDLQPVIDRLALYVAKNGDEFESGIREKNDPRFDFLNPWNIYHAHYSLVKQKHRDELEKQKLQDEERRKNLKVSFGLKTKVKTIGNAKKASSKSNTAGIFHQNDEGDDDDEDEVATKDGFQPKKDLEKQMKKKLEKQIEEKERLLRQLQEQAVLQQRINDVNRQISTKQPARQQSQTSDSNEGGILQNERKRKAASFVHMLKSQKQQVTTTERESSRSSEKSKIKDAFFQAVNDAFKGNQS